MVSNRDIATPASFPFPPAEPPTTTAAHSPATPAHRSRTSTNASSNSASRIRAASIKFIEASPPPGMWAATGSAAAKAPTLGEIRAGSFGTTGWSEEAQKHAAASASNEEGARPQKSPTRNYVAGSPIPSSQTATSTPTPTGFAAEPFPPVEEEDMTAFPSQRATVSPVTQDDSMKNDSETVTESRGSPHSHEKGALPQPQKQEREYSNGYVPPPKVPWTRTTAIGLKAFWKWFLTPAGFLITIYCLNIVAWGGMLFLLLCNAAPAMCHPTCDDIQSPRRIWIEIDSQILNALFCVTGFGLAPWRFRDLYWWTWWRLGGVKRKETGIRRLAGIHRGWFRLAGSDNLPPDASPKTVSPEDPAVPIPISKLPDPPPTGIHAPPTKPWKMDFVLWMNAWNTFFQIVLCFYMWHYNRYDRPSWATGLFVALGCIVAGVGGIMIYHEGKYVKRVEGVPIPKEYGDV